MTTKRFHVDNLLKETLKKEDRVKLPEDPQFFENMHTNIMAAIVNTEFETHDQSTMKSRPTTWSQPWVFLEPGRPTTALEEGTVKLKSKA